MLNTSLLLFSISAYLLAAALLIKHARLSVQTSQLPHSSASTTKLAMTAATVAVIAHVLFATNISHFDGQINYSVSSMAISVSALLVIIFLVLCVSLPIKRLGILVFPVTVLCLVFAYLWDSSVNYSSSQSVAFVTHVLISLLAYSVLTIATLQALLYVHQERQIKHKTSATMLMALPPLQTMESLLFRLLGFGLVLLTLTLLSGALFSEQIFGVPFTFNHHTILASLGWLVFAVLMYKRLFQGLRGTQSVAWVIVGFILIQLGYFGTKIIVEILAKG